MGTRLVKLNLLTAIVLICSQMAYASNDGHLFGKVLSTEKTAVEFATVQLKGTGYGCAADMEGHYHFDAPAGTYTLVVSAIGFETKEKTIQIKKGEKQKEVIILKPSVTNLDELTVASTGLTRVKRSAYNVVAIDTKELQNTTKNLSDALQKLPGMRVRESGGVGSDMQISLDGFTGKHVKIFIDGIPQEGAGTSFDLNNMPVNFAERIEVYKGVVPVGFGTDALGGVINIVTGKQQRKWFADASYSYGSFNTQVIRELRTEIRQRPDIRNQCLPELF